MPRSRPGALAYPDSLYSPPALPDLSRPEDRRRLSGAALKALFNIVKHWEIRDEARRAGAALGTAQYNWVMLNTICQ